MSGPRTASATRWVVLAAFAVFFFVPMWSMVNYTTRDFAAGGRTWANWRGIFEVPEIREPLVVSVELAVLTLVLMLVLLVPTMVWVRLRVPRMTRIVEFLCLLPLTIPPLVVVVGITNTYSWVYYLVGFGDSDRGFGPLTLCFAYVILVLPYAYRAIDASLSSIDAATLAEAARSLGASWFTVIVRVISPNIRGGVITACILSIALVLGEYTFAVLMGFQTLPTALVEVRTTQGGVAMAASLAIMVVISVLMVAISALGSSRRRTSRLGVLRAFILARREDR